MRLSLKLAALGFGATLGGGSGTVSQATVAAPQTGSTALAPSVLSAVPDGNTVTVTNPASNFVSVEFYA